jgi:1-acyl-sn-glycerol-3-phosphate acyltransferase
MLYWLMRYTVVGLYCRLMRPKVEGRELLPDGPIIMAGNHLAFIDSIFLPGVLHRRVTFLAKAEYFNRPGFKGRVVSWLMRSLSQVPIDRSGGAAGGAALDAGLEVLRGGGILCIYPEGTRSPDGRLYRGRTGVARMAVDSGVPVVPVAMIGTDYVQPPGTRIPRIGLRPRIVFGKPMTFQRPEGTTGDAALLRAVTDEIMQALRECSGQAYVDKFSPGPKLARRW